ncbi:hypothetical protein MBLNU459_g4429t1 [Dothideomycetes sp. NU459]
MSRESEREPRPESSAAAVQPPEPDFAVLHASIIRLCRPLFPHHGTVLVTTARAGLTPDGRGQQLFRTVVTAPEPPFSELVAGERAPSPAAAVGSVLAIVRDLAGRKGVVWAGVRAAEEWSL